jgi:hypothetical protein
MSVGAWAPGWLYCFLRKGYMKNNNGLVWLVLLGGALYLFSQSQSNNGDGGDGSGYVDCPGAPGCPGYIEGSNPELEGTLLAPVDTYYD